MDDDEEVPNDLEEERHWNETTDDTTQDDDAETLGIEANSIAATFIATLLFSRRQVFYVGIVQLLEI